MEHSETSGRNQLLIHDGLQGFDRRKATKTLGDAKILYQEGRKAGRISGGVRLGWDVQNPQPWTWISMVMQLRKHRKKLKPLESGP